MKWTETYIPTLKEIPKDATNISHILLLRGGFIKLLSSGVYAYLPLGWKVLKKIINIVREEMDRIGAQELLLPALTPKEIWEKTGRWKEYGDEMFRLKDRKDREYALAPTHEEIMTELARLDIKSYNELPQMWYQIQIKYRDELRPRGAVLRARTFIMMDSYSFDVDEKGLDKSYELHYEAYERIFKRVKLNTLVVSASSGIMGGSESHEFMVPSLAGEDSIVYCENCGNSSNVDVAETEPSRVEFGESSKLEEIYTPVAGSIKEVSKFLSVPEYMLMKSLLYIDGNGKPFFVLIRGDYDINENKFLKNFKDARQAEDDEIKRLTGASKGYVSPIGLDIPSYADISLKYGKNLISGANKDEYHIKGIEIERDVKPLKYIDVRNVKLGDICNKCSSPVILKNTIELGHIFKLGRKYSESIGANFTDRDGKAKPIVMGSYGIGIERIMATAIEVYNDKDGIIWPISISPFDGIITILDLKDNKSLEISEKIYKILKENYDILFDERDIGPGAKFKDADLIGVPIRITIGPKTLKEGKVEISRRDSKEKIKIEPEKVKECFEKIWKDLKN